MPSDQESHKRTIPVIKEKVAIDKRSIDTAKVRIKKNISERNVQLDVTEEQNNVHIERVPVDQIVDVEPKTRQEGDTLIIPVLREEMVIEKKTILVEEIRVTRNKDLTTRKVDVNLKEQEVNITRENIDHTQVDEETLT